MSEKLVKLARALQAKAGDVEWEKTEDEGTFEADFAGFGVQIAQVETEGEETLYTLRIFDADGEFLEEVSDEDLTEILNRKEPTEPSVMFEIMQDIHRAARRSAMGVDKAIDTILDALAAN
jgi:hypothetical protein